MSNLVISNILVTLVGAIPAIAAYLSARHYFDFEQRSFKQFAAVGAGLCGILGPIFLQYAIFTAFEHSPASEYLRKLTLVQFAVALLVFVWKLRKTYVARQTSSVVDSRPTNGA